MSGVIKYLIDLPFGLRVAIVLFFNVIILDMFWTCDTCFKGDLRVLLVGVEKYHIYAVL